MLSVMLGGALKLGTSAPPGSPAFGLAGGSELRRGDDVDGHSSASSAS